MDAVADWYQWIFNFHQIRYFDIEGRFTGLHSRAMTSPCGKIRIPINESADEQQPDRGISPRLQGRRNSAHRLRHAATFTRRWRSFAGDGLEFMPTPPDSYYDRIDQRIPGHGESVERLRELGILIDGAGRGANAPTKTAAADFFQDLDRPNLLRVHPAKGRRGLWRRQFSRAVRIDRRGSNPARRVEASVGVTPMAPPPRYMSGFGNDFETEALAGALPVGQNSPQSCAYGLYAEQLSGSTFTAPRGANQRSWLYRIRPSVLHARGFSPADASYWKTAPGSREEAPSLGQFRWSPVPIPSEKLTFVAGVRTITTAGDVDTRTGMSAGIYFVTQSMVDDYFYNADGELLIVPQQGALTFFTEFGRIDVTPGEICVIPRGVKFKVELIDGPARGYSVRELWRVLHLAESRSDRRQLSRQFARFQDAGRRLRGQRDTLRDDGQMGRKILSLRDRPFAARRRRLAWKLRALQI